MIEDVEEVAIVGAADPDAESGTNCGRAPHFYRSADSTYAASHQTSCRPTISSVSVPTVDVPVQQVMTQEVFKQVPVLVTR